MYYSYSTCMYCHSYSTCMCYGCSTCMYCSYSACMYYSSALIRTTFICSVKEHFPKMILKQIVGRSESIARIGGTEHWEEGGAHALRHRSIDSPTTSSTCHDEIGTVRQEVRRKIIPITSSTVAALTQPHRKSLCKACQQRPKRARTKKDNRGG